MRFEHEVAEEERGDGARGSERGNRWYFFVPLAMVGLWLLLVPARLVALVLSTGGVHGHALASEATEALDAVLNGVDLIGALGWLLLFPFYLLVASNKRVSGWWVLGAFCWGVNLPLYIVLLVLPARRKSRPVPVLPAPTPFGVEERSRSLSRLSKDSFVCESCDAVLNYGVSECHHCGERFVYEGAEPVIDDSPDRR